MELTTAGTFGNKYKKMCWQQFQLKEDLMRGPGRWGHTHTQQGCRGPSLGPGVPPRLSSVLTSAPLGVVSCIPVPPCIHFPCSFCTCDRNSGRGLAREPAAQGGTKPSPRPTDTLMDPAVPSLEICPAEGPGRKTRICRKWLLQHDVN